MINAEMALSNDAVTSAADTVDTRTFDIDVEILKKERTKVISDDSVCSSRLPDRWERLNDSGALKREEEGADTENSGSVTSEPKRQYSRRNSNESTYSAGSTGSSGSKNSAKRKTATKRRSWKKPKDKPKRPLSAYNIFFKHTRSRIIEGLPEEGTTEETIASIEGIVANSTETRRHRKTHGQISFGDLARTIAEKWKTIDQDHRALFDHYAALDMKRYRRDVAIWKAKKESDTLTTSSGNGRRPLSSLDTSASSACTSGSINLMTESQTTVGVGENYDDWNTPQYRALSTSFNSIDSEEDYGFEPIPIGDMPDPKSNSIGQSIPSFIESNSNINNPNNIMATGIAGIHSGNGYNGNAYNSSLQSQKLRDMRMKNRQLEQSINKLKKELSQTSFLSGGNNNSNLTHSDMNITNSDMNVFNSNMNVSLHSDVCLSNEKLLNNPFLAGPSIDRMQQLHRRRMLMGDILAPMANGENWQSNHQGLNGCSNQSSDKFLEETLMQNNMQLEPFDLNPVPLDEVFNATGAEAKKNELMTNLGHLDFFAGNGEGN